MKKLNDTEPYEISKNLWWIGFADFEAGFSNNPYLLIDDDEAVLFDPGPGHPIFRDIILRKIEKIINPEKIKYLIVHHQDPDLCGLLPYIENFCHPDVTIICHSRTALFIPYYGVRKSILPISDDDILELKSGRRLRFIHTPYLHFAGSIITYDEEGKNLFSSDIFAIFSKEWSLYADKKYINLARLFLEHYISDKKVIDYTYEKLKKLEINMILPQHGSIIKSELVEDFIELLPDVNPGKLLLELKNKANDEDIKTLIETGINWFNSWMGINVEADSIDEIIDIAINESPAALTLLLDELNSKSQELGVALPISKNKIHKWDSIKETGRVNLIDSIRNRYLTVQYSMNYGDDKNLDNLLLKRMTALKLKAAVMFIDIRGFTQWSHEKNPDEVIAKLNKQLELTVSVINKNKGRVNKILGDGILAYFFKENVNYSLMVALKIIKLLKKYNMLPVGIGCDFGEVILGDIGEKSRLDYSLIGSTVNTSSRLCDYSSPNEITFSQSLINSLNKNNQGYILNNKTLKTEKVRLKKNDPEMEVYNISIEE